MNKRFMLAGAVLMVVGVAIFVAAFAISGFSFSRLDTAEYDSNAHTITKDFEKIEIRTYEADITFKQSPDGIAHVDCIERGKVKHEVSVENGTLKVIAVDRRSWFDRIALFSIKSQSVTVYLPDEYYKALKLESDTGDVLIPSEFSFGNADITTSTGEVVFNASVNELIKIETSTGGIRISGVHADTVDLSVSTGITEIRNVECRILRSDGSTGDIVLQNVIASDSIGIERNTGDVTFESCDSGQITVETSTGEVMGTLCSEKVFVTETSTGKISVPGTTSGGRCEITTSTGDISIDIIKQ